MNKSNFFIFTLTCFFLTNSTIGLGQEKVGWVTIHGGLLNDFINDIVLLGDTGYLTVGSTASMGNGNFDFYLVNFDTNGVIKQEKTYGGPSSDPGNFFIKNINEHTKNFLIAGDTRSFGAVQQDFYLIKLQPNGDTIWTYQHHRPNSFDYSNGGIQLTNGNYLIVGSITPGNYYPQLLCLDSMGIYQWAAVFDSFPNTSGMQAFEIENKEFLYFCSILDTNGFPDQKEDDLYIIRVDSNGNELNAIVHEDLATINISSHTKDGGFIISGEAKHSPHSNGFLCKLDSNLNIEWSEQYGSDAIDELHNVMQLDDGSYVAVGQTGWTNRLYFIKVDSVGDVIWERFHGGIYSNNAFFFKQTHDGGFVIPAGMEFTTNPQNKDAMLIKTDSNGCIYYPGADFYLSTDTVLLGDTLWLTDSTKVFPEDSLHQWAWDFGDGQLLDSVQHPWHVYDTAGVHTITLEAFNWSNCSDLVQKDIVVKDSTTTTSISTTDPNFVKVYPNPNTGSIIHIELSQRFQQGQFTLFDLYGKMILSTSVNSNHSTSLFLSKHLLPSGVYLWQVQIEDSQPINGKIELIR